MAGEWGAALLTAGAVGSASAGIWVAWQFGAQAQRTRRRVARERVRVTGREDRLLGLMPGMLGGVLLFLLTLVMTDQTPLAVMVGLGGLMIPGWLQEWRETRRLVLLSEQLNQAIGMITTSLRRGTPLEAAIVEAAETMKFPLGPVLRNLADATVLGVTLGQSVEQVKSLPAVTGSTDFQVFATEMVICHERGANVVQAFEALRTVIAARRRYRRQVQEHMGQHLIQALVIAAVGALVLLAFSQMTPEGLGPLLESAIGQLILAISVLGNTFLVRWTHLSLLRQTRRI